MDAQITVKMTDDLRHRVLRNTSPLKLRWPIIWSVFFLAMTLVILILELEGFSEVNWSNPQTWLWVPMVPAAVAVTALLLVVRARYNRAVQSIHSRWGEFDVTYHVTDEGIRFTTPHACGLYPCKDFHRLARFSDMWLLFVDHANAVVLPTDRLTEDVREFLLHKVRECGGQVK
jgi:hypothetical protein